MLNAVLFFVCTHFAFALSAEEAERRLILVTYDQATQDMVGFAADGATSRKAFAQLLAELRKAGVASVFLDFQYGKRPAVQAESVVLAEEFLRFNRSGAPLLLICNPRTSNNGQNAESFVSSAQQGVCGFGSAEVAEVAGKLQQASLIASYCRPLIQIKGALKMKFISADPASHEFSQHRTCSASEKDPAAVLLEHIGFAVDPASYNTTELHLKNGNISKGLDVAFIGHAPVEISMKDILQQKVAAEDLRGKVVMVGSTEPGKDVVRHAGKEQHGVYGYVFTYLALVNSGYRARARASVQEILP